ncbi:MAG: cupin domain-containing protein [Opitutaceae bacterium]|nr:cupin domain-containing protein [Opitutaceae bacterium]
MAERLRQLRLEKGLTLAALASAVGCSMAFLSRVENHKVSIPIAALERLAAALGVSISAFFENQAQHVLISLCRNGEGRKAVLRGPRGFAYEILVGDKKGKLMEPIILDVTAVPKTPLPRPHSGEEFNYILEGECDFLYGKQTIRLRQGDAVYYDAAIPHGVTTVDGKPCRMLAVVASRDYLFHGDLDRLINEGGALPATGG